MPTCETSTPGWWTCAPTQRRWPSTAPCSTRPAAASPTTPARSPGSPVVDVRKDGDDVWHTLAVPDGGVLPSPGDVVHGDRRLGPPPRPDAHPHRPARAVRGDLERVGEAGDRGEHGAAGGPHGLRVRPAARGLRRPGRGAGQRRAGCRPADRGHVPAPGHRPGGQRPHPHQGQHDPRVGRRRSASSTSSASTSRPTAAPMSTRPTRSAGSGWSRRSRRARATSGSASRSSMPDLEALRARADAGSTGWWWRSAAGPTRRFWPGSPTTPSAPTGCWQPPRCRPRWLPPSSPTAVRWRPSGACAGSALIPTSSNGPPTSPTTASAATTARPS